MRSIERPRRFCSVARGAAADSAKGLREMIQSDVAGPKGRTVSGGSLLGSAALAHLFDLVRFVCGAAVLTTAALSASSALAAGFWLYEMGTTDLGTASAGRAASTKDASTVFGNPAGMANLDRSQLLVGAQLVVGDVRFDGARTSVGPWHVAQTGRDPAYSLASARLNGRAPRPRTD